MQMRSAKSRNVTAPATYCLKGRPMVQQESCTGVQANRGPTAGDHMRPRVTTVEIDAHVAAAAYLMRHTGAGALVVTTDDAAQKPIAFVTEADIALAIADGKDLNELRLVDLVRAKLVSVQPGTQLGDAAEIMLSSGLECLTVIERERLFGLLHISDVCRGLVVGTPVKAAATDFGLGIEARSLALLSKGDAAERLYQEAIERFSRTRLHPELASAHLLYGEWLRDEGRPLQAREELRTAHDMFASIGMDAVAERTAGAAPRSAPSLALTESKESSAPANHVSGKNQRASRRS